MLQFCRTDQNKNIVLHKKTISLNKGFARHSTVSVGDLTPAEKIKMYTAAYRGGVHLNLVILLLTPLKENGNKPFSTKFYFTYFKPAASFTAF